MSTRRVSFETSFDPRGLSERDEKLRFDLMTKLEHLTDFNPVGDFIIICFVTRISIEFFSFISFPFPFTEAKRSAKHCFDESVQWQHFQCVGYIFKVIVLNLQIHFLKISQVAAVVSVRFHWFEWKTTGALLPLWGIGRRQICWRRSAESDPQKSKSARIRPAIILWIYWVVHGQKLSVSAKMF